MNKLAAFVVGAIVGLLVTGVLLTFALILGIML
jgi:hypothetical protein